MDSVSQPTGVDRQRLLADLALLAAAGIWGLGFVPARLAAVRLGALTYTGARFLLAMIVLLPFVWPRRRQWTRSELGGGVIAGGILVIAAFTQQRGLQSTTAGNAGFITGLYVVFVPLMLAIVGRRRPEWPVWLASGLAAVALFLLSGVQQLTLAPGDVWVLVGAVFWALHIVVIGRLISGADSLRLSIVQYGTCGILGLALSGLFEPHGLAAIGKGWWAVLYNGVMSIGVAMTLQVIGQRHAPPADAAVLLSGEAVFATLFGWLLISERLSVIQLIGCGLMLAAMLLAQWPAFAAARTRTALVYPTSAEIPDDV
ncbi:MAG: DMT family transporter [Chloroflexi bacterium]|nr:DMT family transporter [Chloroflexota bacterium]